MTTELRNKARSQFAKTVDSGEVKIQVGARGSKISPDWIAIDLFDKSSLIDHNWDLQDLPLEDCSVDCFVCNAILEHLYEPQLAIFEMYRTLKVGGHVWVEVPFSQFYHAHPYDFRRWTVKGLEWEMRRFQCLSSGVTANIDHEVRKIADSFARESKAPCASEATIKALESASRDYAATASPLRLYSGCFVWGKKTSHLTTAAEVEYMKQLGQEVKTKFLGSR